MGRAACVFLVMPDLFRHPVDYCVACKVTLYSLGLACSLFPLYLLMDIVLPETQAEGELRQLK